MTNKYINSIQEAFKNGLINEFMYKRLSDLNDSGISESLSKEVIQDAQDASSFGITEDQDYDLYFFVEHIVDDVLLNTFNIKLDASQRKDLIHFLLSKEDNYDFDLRNMIDFRILVNKWICSRLSKVAHPNIGGKMDKEPKSDLDKWISTLKNIYSVVHTEKMGRGDAVDHFTQSWDFDEKQKFKNWLRFYEDGTMEKYNVKNAKLIKEADLSFAVPPSWAKQERQDSSPYMSTFKPPQKTQRELELEHAKEIKIKMRSRILSFKKLLDKYNDILPKQNIEHIYNEIYNLDKSISRLDILASVQDCIFRSANRIKKFGFSEGAEILEKTAAEPMVGQDVMKSLPKAISDQPNLPHSQMASINIKTIIDRLEGLSKTLKSRDMIRELASVDILLNELGLASYFPELTDAQSKLIEAFGYASNKVEGCMSKLRGSGPGKISPPEVKAPEAKLPTAKLPEAPRPVQAPEKPIEAGEIMSKPVSDVQKELPVAPVAPKKPE